MVLPRCGEAAASAKHKPLSLPADSITSVACYARFPRNNERAADGHSSGCPVGGVIVLAEAGILGSFGAACEVCEPRYRLYADD